MSSKIFIYSLNSDESVSQDNFSDDNYEQIVILADNAYDKLKDKDLTNLKQIISNVKSDTIIFDGAEHDFSNLINKELLSFLFQQEGIKSISIFAKSDDQDIFDLTSINTGKNFTIDLSSFKICKFDQNIEMTLKDIEKLDNYMNLFIFTSKQQELGITIKVTSHYNIELDKNIKIFQTLVEAFRNKQDFKVIITKELEYYKIKKQLCFNPKYILFDEFKNQILSELPIQLVKVIEDKVIKITPQLYAFSLIKSIKESNSQIDLIIVNSNEHIHMNKELDNTLFDLGVSFQINYKNKEHVSWEYKQQMGVLKQIIEFDSIQRYISFFTENLKNKICNLSIVDCYYFLENPQFSSQRQQLFSINSLYIKSSGIKYIQNEKDFKIKINYISFDSITKILQDLYIIQNSQFHRLKVDIQDLINTLPFKDLQCIIQFNLSHFRLQNQIYFTPKELSLQNRYNILDIQDILQHFPNLEKIDLLIESVDENVFLQLIQSLPSTLIEIKIKTCGAYRSLTLILDKENLCIEGVPFAFLDSFKNIKEFNNFKNVNINCYCDQTEMLWMQKISNLRNLNSFQFKIYHRNHIQINGACNSNRDQIIQQLSKNIEFLTSISDHFDLVDLKYKQNNILELYQNDIQVKSQLMRKLSFINLVISIQNQSELDQVIKEIQLRKENNLPKLMNLTLNLERECEKNNLDHQISDIDNYVTSLEIKLLSQTLFSLDFEKKQFKSCLNPTKTDIFISLFKYLYKFSKIYFFNQYPYLEITPHHLKRILSAINPENSLVYIKLKQKSQEIMLVLSEVERLNLKIILTYQFYEKYSQLEYCDLISQLSKLQNKGLLKSFNLQGDLKISNANQNLSFIYQKDRNSFIDINQLQVLKHVINNIRYIKNLNISLQNSFDFSNQKAIELIDQTKTTNIQEIHFQDIYKYNCVKHQNLATQLITEYFFHKRTLIKLLPKLIKVGLDRFEKLEQFFSFFSQRQNFTFIDKFIYEDQSINQFNQ